MEAQMLGRVCMQLKLLSGQDDDPSRWIRVCIDWFYVLYPGWHVGPPPHVVGTHVEGLKDELAPLRDVASVLGMTELVAHIQDKELRERLSPLLHAALEEQKKKLAEGVEIQPAAG
jgi:hypothetical protein